jgi:hypothetical protein
MLSHRRRTSIAGTSPVIGTSHHITGYQAYTPTGDKKGPDKYLSQILLTGFAKQSDILNQVRPPAGY